MKSYGNLSMQMPDRSSTDLWWSKYRPCISNSGGITCTAFVAGLLFLSGCSSMFEEQPKGPWASIKKEYRQCLSNLKTDQELKLIANKVSLESHYDRDEYFELQDITGVPTPKEKIAIKKWASKLERCYKIKSESYAFEPANVAAWSAASDKEQLGLVLELSKGNLSYGDFATKRLEVDTKYRGEIVRAISADYKNHETTPQPKNSVLPNTSPNSNSSCGWQAGQWVCRSL
jgi:hypothetical protein